MYKHLKHTLGVVLSFSPMALQTSIKKRVELMYWKKTLRASKGTFYNGHFERAFTEVFELSEAYFDGKRMLDIGCGPLGSLEWATGAAERVGVDPLASRYLQLNRGAHTMRYVEAPAENLPFADAAFDIVSMFNALDHVENTSAAMREAERVLSTGGDLLLIVEINHPPTLTEPQTLGKNVLECFPNCSVVASWTYSINECHDVYGSIFEKKPPARPDSPAIICARLRKRENSVDR